jgi:hypothetical protein
MFWTVTNDSVSMRTDIMVDIIDWYPYSIATAYRPTRQLTMRCTWEVRGLRFLQVHAALMHYFAQHNSSVIGIMIIGRCNPVLTMSPSVSGDATISLPTNRTRRTANTAIPVEVISYTNSTDGLLALWQEHRTQTVVLSWNSAQRHASPSSLQRLVLIFYR